MALTEVKSELPADLGHDPYTEESSDSIHMINSLREIPLVDTSVDLDSVLSDRIPNLTASIFSTPRYDSGPSSARSRLDDLDAFGDSKYPFSDLDTDSEDEDDGDDEDGAESIQGSGTQPKSADASENTGTANARDRKSFDSIGSARIKPPKTSGSTSSRSFASARSSPAPSISRDHQLKQLEHISKGVLALESMAEFIDVWAPTAHSVVVTAAALQRDAAAFASTLDNLLLLRNNVDPQNFSTQFYQLREAYASLVSSSSIAAGSSGAGTWTQAFTKLSKVDSAPMKGHDLETTWDDRQLVDSFMTLLRTSPGFIASAFSQFSQQEADVFCAAEEGSALNTLFHGVMGSAEQFRAEFFAEMLSCTTSNVEILGRALLARFLALSLGKFAQSSATKLERFLRLAVAALNNGSALPNFEPVLMACVPFEFAKFAAYVAESSEDSTFNDLVADHLKGHVHGLVTSPHRFGVLTDTFIGERLGRHLETIAQQVCSNLPSAWRGTRTPPRNGALWAPDQLVVVKGSDILQLYQSLLPVRGTFRNSAGSGASSASSDEDEWCLENIRSDLVPVIRELAHSSGRADGWQVFKVGVDGLVTDLGNDMGLVGEDNTDDEAFRTVCDAIGKHEGSLCDRIAAAREDAELKGDHIAVLELCELSNSPSIDTFLDRVNHVVATQKQRCRVLRRTLDQAAKDQHRERERLISLLSILDVARLHVWYEAEVRPCTPFYRARESLRMLYPFAKGDVDEADKMGDPSSLESSYGGTTGTKSRRLSILSVHSAPESPFYNREVFPKSKLTDREVDAVLIFMRRNRVRHLCPAEELFPRALVEIGQLSRKLVDRDHLAGYITFKRDRHYQSQHNQAQQQAQAAGTTRQNKRVSQHRRSSLGLFDFFDSGSYAPVMPVTLHSSTSTQFLGLASSHDSLRSAARPDETRSVVGPPKGPTTAQVTALLLSDLGQGFMSIGTETDMFMQQTGRMLLEGDGLKYQPLLDDLSHAGSPEAKLAAAESLVHFARTQLKRKQGPLPSRSDVIHEMSRAFGREPGTLYRDLETISFLVHPNILERSEAFADVCDAAQNVLESVIARGTDYAARFLRYYLETKTTAAPQMSSMGIADSVAIWAFCAKCGNVEAQQKLAELYLHFPNLVLEVRPLSRPANVVEGVEPALLRDAIAQHWFSLASRI